MRIPVATYRLQFNRNFRFSDAKAIVPYLHDLGISDIYASPIFQARAGSLHGYDIVDPNQLNPELGLEGDFESLLDELHGYDMGWIQDIVPNHMAYDGQNQKLMDVLESGQDSPFFDYFDIDWNHPYENIKGRVLAPFLGNIYSQSLENGEITLSYGQAGLSVNYYSLKLPFKIESYTQVFTQGLGSLRRRLGGQHPDFIKLLGALYALKTLPSGEEPRERSEQIMFAKNLLWELYGSAQEIREFFDSNLARFNGERGNPTSFDALDQLLTNQMYRLSFWKVAAEEINYRRFFNINELISLRVEDEKVFRETHALVFKLISEGKINGLRIDHIDGLYDPTGYLNRLRQKGGDLYLSVEKILSLDERLPGFWPVQGTTGYDLLNYVNGIFCDERNEHSFTRLYASFIGTHYRYADLVSEKKRLMIGKLMAGDVDNLAHLLKRISSKDRDGSDITLYGLKRALVEVLTFFPVYRSYISHEDFTEDDQLHIEEAVSRAKETNPGLLLELDFIEKSLLLGFQNPVVAEEKKEWIDFAMRFQQLTGPLMAKGFEDTTLYVFNRLLSLNTVGGNPGRFGLSLEEFHRFIRERASLWPHSMNATSTHDAKQGEDVRARINVLSEMPEEWEKKILTWNQINKTKKTLINGKELPDKNDEYFLYQSLVGAFPFVGAHQAEFRERVKSYMLKAVREAKVYTAWLKPDLIYEAALAAFIDKIIEPKEANEFYSDFFPFAKEVARLGMLNSLSQTLLKVLSPGVPDFYQGTELWELSFVDPDNRRPTDFSERRKLLEELKQRDTEDPAGLVRDLLDHWEDGRVKLYLIYKAMNFRRSREELFREGSYTPVCATGRTAAHICAFARRNGENWALAAAPRLITKLAPPGKLPLSEVWEESALALPEEAPRRWRNILTREKINIPSGAKKVLRLASVFQHFPVALLASEGTIKERSPS